MSSKGYAAPLRLEPRRSRRLLSMILAAHTGGLAVAFLANIPGLLRLALGLWVVPSAFIAVRRHLGGRSVRQAIWEVDGGWSLIRADGLRVTAQLLPETYLSPWLVVLRFRGCGVSWRPVLVLLPDSLDSETFRRLRVRMRLHRTSMVADAVASGTGDV